MKPGFALTLGILISTVALFYYKPEVNILKYLKKEVAEPPAAKKDSASVKKQGLYHGKRSARPYAATNFLVPPVGLTAVKTVDKTSGAVSGDILTYSILITNNGATDVTGLTFSDNIDPNTTLVANSVKVSPVAANDAYASLGNVGITVPDANGVLVNDYAGQNPAATLTAVTNAATTQGGTISLTANGGFTYMPPAGFTGDDTYTYTLSNDAGSSSATITISVSGMVWFINNNSSASTADGRLTTPFKTLAAFQAINDGTAPHAQANQAIFIYESVNAYAGPVTLLNGQKLIGQDATASLATIAGLTLPTYSNALPVTNSAPGAIVTITSASNAVNLATGATNTIRGLTIGNTTGSGIANTTNFGTLTVSDVSINGTGQALNLVSGALSATLTELSANGTNGVSLTSITGTLTAGSGTITGGSQAAFAIAGGSVSVTYSGSMTQANNAALVNVTGGHTGTLTFQTGNLGATNGGGLQFQNASGSYNFNGTTALSGSAGVNIVSSSGTFAFGANTSISSPSDTAFNVLGGTATSTYSGNITQAANNYPLVCVAQGHATGTITFNTGTLNASTGTGLQFDNADGTYNFNGTTTLGGGDSGIDLLNDCDGSFTFSTNTTITNPSGTGFAIGSATAGSGGNSSVTYNGTISKSGTGRVIEIQNKGGGTVAFAGAVSGTASSTGINLATNSGTFNFTGGVSLNGTGAVFAASNSGTLNITGSSNVIGNTTAPSATALTISGTSIGSSGVTFQQVNCNGAVKGIVLNNTGAGAFTVSGTGTTAGSGGTITNIQQRGIEITTAQNISLSNMTLTNANTADAGLAGVCDELTNGGCYAAVYISSATTVSLTQVNVTTTEEEGLNLNNVTGLTISNCTVQGNGNGTEEGALKAFDLKGTCSISNSTFKNSAYRIAHIRNSSGSVHLSVSNSQFINDATNLSAIKQDCFQMRTSSNAIATVLINSCTFKRAGTKGIQVYAQDQSTINLAITGSTVDRDGTAMGGIEAGSDQTATMNVHVDNNPLITANGEVALNLNSGTSATTQAIAQNNTIKGGNNPNLNAFAVTRVFAFEKSTNNASVSGNTVTDLDAQGILSGSSNNSGAGTSNLNSTIKGNTVTGTSGLTSSGIRVSTVTNNASAFTTNCTYITTNNVTVVSPTDHLRVVTGSTTSTVRLPGTGTTLAQVWDNNSNSPNSGTAVLTVNQLPGSTITYGGAVCTLPTNTSLPTIAGGQPGVEFQLARLTEPIPVDSALLPGATVMPVAVPPVRETAIAGNAIVVEDEKVNNTVGDAVKQQTAGSFRAASMSTVSPSVTVSVGTLPAAKSLAIQFQVTVNDNLPASVCSIQNQGVITGTNISSLLTDNDADATNGLNPTVTTILDETKPVVNNCPGDITVQTGPGNTTCTQTATWTEPTATDNCSGALTYYSRTYAPGATFSKGSTPVTYVFRDAAGNESTCTFNVVVQDNTAPVVSNCPQDVTVYTGPGNTTCTQTATWTEPTATDNCDAGTLTYFSRSHAPGSTFAIGTTPVTYVFKDADGNESECHFNVVVKDNTPPVISNCPTDITVQTGVGRLTCDQTATWTAPTATDNCGGTITPYYVSHTPGSLFNVGQTTVTYKFKDGAGNENECHFNVIVQDNTKPAITCPSAITAVESTAGSGTASVSFSVSATDNCTPSQDITIVVKEGGNTVTSGSLFTVGLHNLTATATDGSGNPNSCNFTITVNPACQITPPANIEVNAPSNQCGATVTYDDATTTGNCGPLTYSKPSGSFFDVGVTTVTISSSSTGQTATFNVTVKDVTPPTLSCPANIEVSNTLNECSASVPFAATATDNCSDAAHITVKYYIAYGTSSELAITSPYNFPVGVTTVTVTAKDAAGNNATACTFTVKVNDTQKPTVTCPANKEVNKDAGKCTASVSFSANPSDNCPGVTVKYYLKYGTPGQAEITSPYDFPIGASIVTAEANDAHNNSNICSFTVTVNEPAPTVSAVTATPNVLWPPDHKMRDITLTYSISPTSCSYVPKIVVTSTDPISGVSDGDKFPDWIVIDDHHLQLRAERGNGKEARVYTITVTAYDGLGHATNSQSTEVRIAHNITAPVTGSSFKVGSTVAFSGVFWDKPGNRHTGQWLIDDNTTVKGTITEPSGTKNGKLTGSYKFTTAGVYRLQMNVTDQNKVTSYCNTNEDMEEIVVIYDPNGGYTYGGGWFTSPAGALKSDPTATGKGNFGFSINYYKGATYPKGETQFDFKVGDLQYNALNFDYLAISGARAQFSGTGRVIGGQSGINFIMTVIDGALNGTGVDKVRMKIYNKNTGEVYYDSQPGASDAADPTTPVGTNSDVVISGTSVLTRWVAPVETTVASVSALDVNVYPNPTSTSFILKVSSSNIKERVNLVVTDLLGRVVEVRSMAADQSVSLGTAYRPGVYLARVLQGKEHKEVRLVKLSD